MRRITNQRSLLVPLAGCLALGFSLATPASAETSPRSTFSTPILLDPTEAFLYGVNPDNDTVSMVPTNAALGTKGTEYPTGREPQALAMLPDGKKLYVSNTLDGTVSVFNVQGNGSLSQSQTIRVGVEPWGLALTPNGKKLYVANSSSNSLSVIDTAADAVVTTIQRVGYLPRALAITNDGDTVDTDEKVYVTNFLARYRAGEVKPGDDLGKVGLISVVSTATDELVKTAEIAPLANVGFNSDGKAFGPVTAPTGTATIPTGAFPNILAGLELNGTKLYIPSTGSSPNGPNRFNVNVQSLFSVLDTQSDTDAGKTVNLNKGINFEPDSFDGGQPVHRFVTNPYAFRLKSSGLTGYVVSAASDMIVKVDINPDGTATINAPPASGQTGNVKRVFTGSNPRGIVITRNDSRAYVWNYVSRDVTVVDAANDKALGSFTLASLPTDAASVKAHRGKQLFNTSIGPLFLKDGVQMGAMSDRGWGSCASCHPDGLTDGVVWMFPAGPRFSTPLNATFTRGGTNQRALNWSAIFDEVEDFELNTRNVFGGPGLIRLGDGSQDTNVNAFTVPSHGRSADRDSITDYFKTIRTPLTPVPAIDVRAAQGRKIFANAGCTTCHGGANWTSSKLEFTPPPPATALVAEQGTPQLVGQLKQVGTFDATKPFEVIGTGANISKQALGTAGYNPPSLRGIFAFGPYLHNGSAVTLDELLDNKAHVGNSPLLNDPSKRAKLVRFLQSIDDSTPTFP